MKLPKLFNFNFPNILNKAKKKEDSVISGSCLNDKKYIKNLTYELKRVHCNGYEFETLFDKFPNLNRTVGSLPQKWGRKIGSSKEKRESINKLFSDFAKKFHSINCDNPNPSTARLQQKLSKVLETSVEISSLGSGSWGKTYKITADSQSYVLKVFFNKQPQGYDTHLHYYGNYNELASAVYASKHDADHFVTFYMGRFGEKGDGYLLTKFLTNQKNDERIFNGMPENDPRNFVFSSYLHKLRCYDNHSSNQIAKKIIDFGNTDTTKASNLEPPIYKLVKLLGLYIDTNNSKGISEILSKQGNTENFKKARSFLQKLIKDNLYTISKNIQVLEQKSELLDKLGLKIMFRDKS